MTSEIIIVSIKQRKNAIVIKNKTKTPQDMNGWSIAQSMTGLVFNFPKDFVLGSYGVVTIYSKEGNNNKGNLYWNLNQKVWDEIHDTAMLKYNNSIKSVFAY